MAIDWHNWHLSLEASDLAFLIAYKWQARRRSEHELALLRHTMTTSGNRVLTTIPGAASGPTIENL